MRQPPHTRRSSDSDPRPDARDTSGIGCHGADVSSGIPFTEVRRIHRLAHSKPACGVEGNHRRSPQLFFTVSCQISNVRFSTVTRS